MARGQGVVHAVCTRSLQGGRGKGGLKDAERETRVGVCSDKVGEDISGAEFRDSTEMFGVREGR